MNETTTATAPATRGIATRYFCDIVIEEYWTTSKNAGMMRARMSNIEPQYLRREGKTIDIAIPHQLLARLFSLPSMSDEHILRLVIGATRRLTFMMEESSGTISGIELLMRRLTLRDKEAVEKVEPAAKKGGAESAKKADRVDDTEDAFPPCTFCDNGRAIGVGQTCTHCKRHVPLPGVVTIIEGDLE